MAEPSPAPRRAGSGSLSVKAYDPQALRLGVVVVAVAAQVWPLLALTVLTLGAAVVWSAVSGDRVILAVAFAFTRTVVLGLVGAFALHEAAHVLVLRRVATVTQIVLDRTAWRLSVIPVGTISPRQSAAVAVAGPAACVLVGAALWLTRVDGWLAWWFLAHALFLLPVFGDGRALVSALWRWRSTDLTAPEETAPPRTHSQVMHRFGTADRGPALRRLGHGPH